MGRRRLAPLALGLGIWALGFVVIYAVQGLGCAFGWDRVAVGGLSLLRLLVGGLVLATLLAVLIAARRLAAWQAPVGPASFIRWVSATCAWFALPATALTFSGVLMTSACT